MSFLLALAMLVVHAPTTTVATQPSTPQSYGKA